jgi:hypothetical protein
MLKNPKTVLASLLLFSVSIVANATTNNELVIDFTVKKDSLQQAEPDTLKPAIVFPNPFISIWGLEPKKD